jgi:D-alanine-D-alanine ligase-like ATP-grasp enzyme
MNKIKNSDFQWGGEDKILVCISLQKGFSSKKFIYEFISQKMSVTKQNLYHRLKIVHYILEKLNLPFMVINNKLLSSFDR